MSKVKAQAGREVGDVESQSQKPKRKAKDKVPDVEEAPGKKVKKKSGSVEYPRLSK